MWIMAGVWRTKDRNGKPHRRWRGWYYDRQGRRRRGSGTQSKVETLALARYLESEYLRARLARLLRPRKSDGECAFDGVAREYLSWGASQGGRGGRPWSGTHARTRKRHLPWWQKRLGLKLLADLEGSLPRVERELRGLQGLGRSGKTVQAYAGSLVTFCNWCVRREYLDENPLKHLAKFDATPRTRRRAMTVPEIRRLLETCHPERRTLYELASASGLRAGELRALKVKHLSVARSGLKLEAGWTKNRKAGFHPLPAVLVERLAEEAKGKDQEEGLIHVPSHPARAVEEDLTAAGIPKWTTEGKLDFHAFRVTYTTLVCEAGATVKEAQTLARHSTPELTMNIYARARMHRLHEIVELTGSFLSRTAASRISS